MRYIKKRSAPKELRQWFAGQPIAGGGRINCRYGDMPGEVKDVVRQRLLEEQGWLCCYTGRRVGTKSSHIEHLKPQSRCEGHEDIAYGNLLAAYPGLDERSPYGAHAKADWYDPALMVSPLDGQCESRFRFDMGGHIAPATAGDRGAEQTILRLRLDNGSLTEMRRAAIDEALFPDNKALSKAKLRTVAVQGFCLQDSAGRYPGFCFVVGQVAQQVLRRAEGDRKRGQAMRNRARR